MGAGGEGENKYYGYKILSMCLFWLAFRFSKENILETSVIFHNALIKVVFKLRSTIKNRICVSSQFLFLFS